jgi:hypothetical protein
VDGGQGVSGRSPFFALARFVQKMLEVWIEVSHSKPQETGAERPNAGFDSISGFL